MSVLVEAAVNVANVVNHNPLYSLEQQWSYVKGIAAHCLCTFFEAAAAVAPLSPPQPVCAATDIESS